MVLPKYEEAGSGITKKETRATRHRPGPRDGDPAFRRHQEARRLLGRKAGRQARRSEAIRRLVEAALATTGPAPKRSRKAAAKAAGMAGEMIDRLADKSASPEEQAKRKRRLMKGPPEFREMRGDLPKPKGVA